jgi:hypothetical protein
MNTRVNSLSNLYLLYELDELDELDEFNELDKFYEFIEKFNKKYHSFNELEERFCIFSKNLRSIILNNLDIRKNFTMCINEFSDLTSEEIKRLEIDNPC